MNEDRCLCCGEIIPEGTHICPMCQRYGYHELLYIGTVKKDGREIGSMTGIITEVANWAEMEIRSNGNCEINIRRVN